MLCPYDSCCYNSPIQDAKKDEAMLVFLRLEAILISGNGSQVGHLNYYKGKFNAYQRTYIVGEFKDNVDISYLYHYLKYTLGNLYQ